MSHNRENKMDNINNDYRTSVIEALILSSPEPLAAKKIAEVIEDMTPSKVGEAIEALNEKYRRTDSSFRIRQIAGGYQCYITEEYSPFVDELHTRRRNVRLSRPALETLAIIAYRQPVTKIDVEMIRGVASDSAIHTLLERKLITMAGRSPAIGRPLLYKTTDEFLKYFNLNTLNDLPQMSEIEELISSDEDSSQQNLPLGPFSARHANGKNRKLTIARGPEDTAGQADDGESEPAEITPDELEENDEAMAGDDEAVYIPAENSLSLEERNFESDAGSAMDEDYSDIDETGRTDISRLNNSTAMESDEVEENDIPDEVARINEE